MPHNLIVPFCLACRVSVEWLLTGIGPIRSRKPPWAQGPCSARITAFCNPYTMNAACRCLTSTLTGALAGSCNTVAL